VRTFVLVVLGGVALILLGWLAVSLIGTILKLGLYLLVGAALVGGGYYLYGRARRSLGGNRRRSLPRN
jgi:hypothetical protein